MVSGFTPRCAAISATDNQRSFMFSFRDMALLSRNRLIRSRTQINVVCPSQPEKSGESRPESAEPDLPSFHCFQNLRPIPLVHDASVVGILRLAETRRIG